MEGNKQATLSLQFTIQQFFSVIFTMTKLAFVTSRLAAPVVGDNQVSDKEEHVSADERGVHISNQCKILQ